MYLEGLCTLDDVRDRESGIKLSNHQEVCGYSSLGVAWLCDSHWRVFFEARS